MIKTTAYLIALLAFATVAPGQSQGAGSSANCRPEVVVDSILDSVRVAGKLRMGPIEGRCLPIEKRPGSVYVYEPGSGRKFTSTLRESKGRTINVFAWYGTPRFDGVRFDKYEIVGGEAALETLREGSYAIDFALDGRVFQSFPFTVSIKESGDPLRPGKIFLTDGAWRDTALLTGSSATVTCFHFRLRADFQTAGMIQVKVPYSVRLLRGNSVVAETRDGQLSLDANWYTFRTCLDAPIGAPKGTQPPRLSDLLADEGVYRIVLSVNGRPYAEYDLTVRDGRFNGDTAQGKTYRIKMTARRTDR